MPCRIGPLERRVLPEQWGIVPIIDPDRWPDEVRLAYEAAGKANDWQRVAAIVEAQTGERPSPDRRDVGALADRDRARPSADRGGRGMRQLERRVVRARASDRTAAPAAPAAAGPIPADGRGVGGGGADRGITNAGGLAALSDADLDLAIRLTQKLAGEEVAACVG
jgi:hypothetical protein